VKLKFDLKLGLKPNSSAKDQFQTEVKTEVNLSIGLKPDFPVQIKLRFKTIV